MDSDKSDEDEHEAISKQIVEYYKKYSLSQQLPKYFSGTPLSYMPKIVKEEELNKPLIVVEDADQVLVEKQSEYCQTDGEEATELKAISPASSVASNRKLEWDSGADIGYNNCNKPKLHKSFSLPTLTMSAVSGKVKEKPIKTKLSSHIVTVISYSGSSDQEKPTPSSSSSSSFPIEAPVASTSSSSAPRPPSAKPLSSSSSSSVRPPSRKPSSSSSSSFANTLAYLKSKIGAPDAESTPKILTGNHFSGVKLSETPSVPKIHKELQNRVVELCVTKPISIECMEKKSKKALDKRVQTSFVEKLSKSVQTGDVDVEESGSKKLINGPKENQSVIIINYDNDGDKKTYSSNTQTESECIPSPESVHEANLKKMKAKCDATDFSKEISLLGDLISRKQSKSLVGDIDRSIELLQKLLRSKKYDPATKKKYIKKIVEKIVDNKYTEDSTTSSELFLPRKTEDKVPQKLQENIPWYPPKISTFGVKALSDEGHPQEGKQKSVFTATNSPTTCVESSTSLEKQPNTSSGSSQSWKEDKTLSERLLEEKQTNGGGDQLIKFAMKERQNQLSWINDEISHLTKLKGLLEKKLVHTTTTVYMVSQQHQKKYCTRETCPNLNRNNGRFQQVNGRVCTPETCPFLAGSAGNSREESTPETGRNYVIQTEISEPTSEEGIINLDLGDESGKTNYKVQQVMRNRRDDVIGNIEVFSDDQTTNIKVKTRQVERIKPKDPAVVRTEKYDTYPRSRQEERRCWPCGIIQGRRDRDLIDSQKYRFDVPVTKKAEEIMRKVDEIVNKYGSKSSVDACSEHTHKATNRPCQCRCKCVTDQTPIPPVLKCNKDIQCNVGCKCQTVRKVGSSSLESSDRDRKKQTVDASCQCICLTSDKTQTNDNLYHDKDVPPKISTDDNKIQLQREITCNCVDASVQCICYDKHYQTQTDENLHRNDENVPSKISTDENKMRPQRKITCNCEDAGVQCIFSTKNQTQTDENLQRKDKYVPPKISTDENKMRQQRKITCNCEDAGVQCNFFTKNQTQTVENLQREDKDVPSKISTDENKIPQSKITSNYADAKAQCICSGEDQTQTEETNKSREKGKYEFADAKIQCTCVQDGAAQTEECRCKKAQRETSDSGSSKSSSNSLVSAVLTPYSDSEMASSASIRSCICCKKKNVTSRELYALRKKLSENAVPLCRPCYTQNRRCAYSFATYTSPGYVCNCYTMVETRTLNAIKKTMIDLEECCSCVDADNHSNSSCCQYCKRKLKKTSRNRNGIAYVLTFQNASMEEQKKEDKKLEEIKIKIPVVRKKRYKDKENKRRKKSQDDNEVVYTLQEYLNVNRPEFVETAEERRKVVRNSRNQREEVADRNKLMFLNNYRKNQEKNSKRLFSEKEMKEITKRNYRKLPEVQRKLVVNREKQIRQANKLIADTFNRKLREKVLKGQRTLPTNINVVNL